MRSRVDVWLRLGGAAALTVAMFAMRWYGAAGPTSGAFTAPASQTRGPWQALTIIRWPLVATVIVTLLGVALELSGSADAPLSRGIRSVTVGLAAVSFVGVFYRVLINPPVPGAIDDIKLGAYVGLIAVGAILVGSYQPRVGPVPGRVRRADGLRH